MGRQLTNALGKAHNTARLTMYDLAMANEKSGKCCKCNGTGVYRWGTFVNGVASKQGTCFSCRGTGKQSRKQIAVNHTYNRYKITTFKI